MHKPGSTLSKAVRYEGFICELADYDSKVPFYQRQYPDGFAPEVLFLVPRPERADSINRALTESAAQRRARWKLPRALTIVDAVRDILTDLGQWAPELERTPNANAHRSASLSAHQVKLLCSFFDDAVAALKKLRGQHEQETRSPLSTRARLKR